MSKYKEFSFIEDWNEIIDFQLNETNLKHPNFRFFYGALESLLVALNYDIEQIKESVMENDAERRYLIKFCSCVNELYQLSGSSNQFFYYDLIKPVPKKCFHVLKTLLNYLIYYRMLKKEVCTEANGYLAAYDEVLVENSNLLKKINGMKTRATDLKSKLSGYEKTLPKLQKDVAAMKAEKQQSVQYINDRNTEIKQFETDIVKAEVHRADLESEVVTNDQYQRAVDTLDAEEAKLAELDGITEHARSSNVGSCAQVEGLAKQIDGMTNILSKQKLPPFEELIESQDSLKATNDEIVTTEQKINELTAKLNSLMTNANKFEKEIATKEDQLKKIQKEFHAESTKMKRTNTDNNIKMDEAKAELDVLQSQFVELEEQQRFLMTSILQIMQRTSKSFF